MSRRIVFLTLYDNCCFGARSLAAECLAAGHDAHVITFKSFDARAFPREEIPIRLATEAKDHLPCVEVHPFHDILCPYPTPVTANEFELLYERLKQIDPEFVGFSLTSAHLPLAQTISRELRRREPHLRQIWGGVHPTMDPQGSLQFADAVCAGEADDALLEYLQDPTRTTIRNFHFRDAGNACIANPLRPLIQDIDRLPPPLYGSEREILIEGDQERPFSAYSAWEVQQLVAINSQRGCPFPCTYCLHGNMRELYHGEKYLRRKSVDRILDEVELRVRHLGLTGIPFWDDVFVTGPQWIEEFCDKYPKRIGLPFGGYSHPSTANAAMLRQLKDAGANFVSVGIQSGSPRIANEIYDRRTSNEKHIEHGRLLHECGYEQIVYDLLTNAPWECEDDCLATVNLLAQLPRATQINLKKLVIYPFSKISRLPRPETMLPEKVFFFYNMIYLLSIYPEIDHACLPLLARDAGLRERPEAIESMVRGLAQSHAKRQQLQEENAALRARQQELEQRIPWGVRRAASHLVRQSQSYLHRKLGKTSDE